MKNKQTKKQFKWELMYELIVLITLSLFDIYCIIYHITLNGFNLIHITQEIVIYFSLTFVMYYIARGGPF